MSDNYYNAADLNKFGSIGEFQKPVADKFFDWYSEVFKDSALTAKEKSLIALAVSHAVQCPYCIALPIAALISAFFYFIFHSF